MDCSPVDRDSVSPSATPEEIACATEILKDLEAPDARRRLLDLDSQFPGSAVNTLRLLLELVTVKFKEVFAVRPCIQTPTLPTPCIQLGGARGARDGVR